MKLTDLVEADDVIDCTTETELPIRFMLAVDVLVTEVLIALFDKGLGGLAGLVLGLQGDAGGDVFGGVGGSIGISSWPDMRLGRLGNCSDDFRMILELELIGVCGGFSTNFPVTRGLDTSSGSSSSS